MDYLHTEKENLEILATGYCHHRQVGYEPLQPQHHKSFDEWNRIAHFEQHAVIVPLVAVELQESTGKNNKHKTTNKSC